MRDTAGYDDAEDPRLPAPVAAGPPAVIATAEQIERLRREVVEELTRRETELERRERSLAEQLAAIDRERRNARLAEQEFEQRTQARESALIAKEADLAHRLTRCEALIAELEEEHAAVGADRADVESQKAAIREALLRELAAERQVIDAEREALFNEKKDLRRRIAEHEKETASARDELRKNWEVEREALRKQLTAKLAAEVSAERRAFEQQRAEWDHRRREEQAELDDARVEHERLVEKAKADLERLRREQEIEFSRRRRDLEAEIEAQVRTAESAFHKERSEWEAERTAVEAELREIRAELNERRAAQEEALRAAREEFERLRESRLREIDAEAAARKKELDAEHEEWLARRDAAADRLGRESAALEQARKEFEAEQQARRERVTAELAELRRTHDRELQDERDAFLKEQESLRLALDEERAVMENRLHFQREHLERTRDELEETRRELECRLQEGRAQAVVLAEQFRLRQAHLARFRRLLDDRERAIDRERAMLAEASEQTAEHRRRELIRRQEDEDAWLREKQAEQVALQQLRDDLGARAEQLATRQSRLDTLRLEIETTHRENLELRVALDETWAKLAQSGNVETAKQQLVASRALVAEHFRRKEAEIDRRRSLLAEEAGVTRKQLDQVDARRKDLAEWLAESLGVLHRREEELKRWATTLDARESRSQATAARWRSEKAEAEGVIRGLLKQLAEAAEQEPTVAALPEPPAAIPRPELPAASARPEPLAPPALPEPAAPPPKPLSGPNFRLTPKPAPTERAAG